jgi:5-methylcytosine-specific restriction endonuclease McrA
MDKENCANSGNTEEKKILTDRQEQYVAAYRRLGSSTQVAVEMRVSAKTAKENILAAARRLGYKTTRELATSQTPRTTRTKDGRATAESLMGLIKSQEYRCQLSGILLEPSTAALDHKIPVSSGGTDSIENLQWVSCEVNRAKGSMEQQEFITMCKRVASWNS